VWLRDNWQRKKLLDVAVTEKPLANTRCQVGPFAGLLCVAGFQYFEKSRAHVAYLTHSMTPAAQGSTNALRPTNAPCTQRQQEKRRARPPRPAISWRQHLVRPVSSRRHGHA
jgi:hypothetical protein